MEPVYLVYGFSNAAMDFVFFGVYSKKEDADEHNARLPLDYRRADPTKGVLGPVPMDDAIEYLLSARLGKLASVLERLVALSEPIQSNDGPAYEDNWAGKNAD